MNEIVTANLAFKNMSDEQMMEINGGEAITVIMAVVSVCITVYGIYETGKNHIYDNSYEKAYNAESERLKKSESNRSGGSGGSGVMYRQVQ